MARLDPATGLFAVFDEHGRRIEDASRFLRAIDLRGLSPRTVRAYAHDLVVMYRWLDAGGLTLETLREADLFDLISSQREQGAKPRSINRRLTVARQFFRFVTGRGLDGAGVSAPTPYFRGRGRDRSLGIHKLHAPPRLKLRVKVPRTLVEPLNRKQVRSFLRTVRTHRDLAIVYLMLLCGLRSREVLQLRTSDVDVTDRRLRVRGKGGKERMLPMRPVLLEVLRRYGQLERPDDCDSEQLFVVLQGEHRGQPPRVSEKSSVAGARPRFWRRPMRIASATRLEPRWRGQGYGYRSSRR